MIDGSRKRILYIVGCGGVAFHAMSLLKAQIGNGEWDTLVTFDPDKIEAKNVGRQWGPQHIGKPKATEMVTALGDGETLQGEGIRKKFTSPLGFKIWKKYFEKTGEMLTVFAWPDSNQARIDACDFALTVGRQGVSTILVTAGSVAVGAQAMGLAVHNKKVLWDFRQDHPEIDGITSPDAGLPGCGFQTALSNAHAATMSVQLYEYIKGNVISGLEPDKRVELYWEAQSRHGARSFELVRGGNNAAPKKETTIGA